MLPGTVSEGPIGTLGSVAACSFYSPRSTTWRRSLKNQLFSKSERLPAWGPQGTKSQLIVLPSFLTVSCGSWNFSCYFFLLIARAWSSPPGELAQVWATSAYAHHWAISLHNDTGKSQYGPRLRWKTRTAGGVAQTNWWTQNPGSHWYEANTILEPQVTWCKFRSQKAKDPPVSGPCLLCWRGLLQHCLVQCCLALLRFRTTWWCWYSTPKSNLLYGCTTHYYPPSKHSCFLLVCQGAPHPPLWSTDTGI